MADDSFFFRRLDFGPRSLEESPDVCVLGGISTDLRFLDPFAFFVPKSDLRDLLEEDLELFDFVPFGLEVEGTGSLRFKTEDVVCALLKPRG